MVDPVGNVSGQRVPWQVQRRPVDRTIEDYADADQGSFIEGKGSMWTTGDSYWGSSGGGDGQVRRVQSLGPPSLVIIHSLVFNHG